MTCFLYNNCNHKDCNKDFCLRKFKLEHLYKEAKLSDFQREKTVLRVDANGTDLEEFKQLAAIEQNIINFIKNGENLYLWSANCGNGKTSWGIRFLQAFLGQIWPTAALSCQALFVDVVTFLNAIKVNLTTPNEYAQHILANAKHAELVIWDDIGAKLGTSFEINTMLDILNYRIYHGKANVFTSNVSPADLKNILDIRLASRIVETSKIIELKGSDKRSIGKENNN